MPSSRSYPDHPYVGVSALICHNDHLILIERGNAPLDGCWSLPGGAVETGEHLEAAIQREIQEEVGLSFTPEHLAELVEILRHDDHDKCQRHFVIAVFHSDISEKSNALPALTAGDDAQQARWVRLEDLDRYVLTDGTFDVIHRILSGTSLPLSRA